MCSQAFGHGVGPSCAVSGAPKPWRLSHALDFRPKAGLLKAVEGGRGWGGGKRSNGRGAVWAAQGRSPPVPNRLETLR
jgi:hypothetical protein